MPEVFAASGKRSSLTLLPQPAAPVTGSPFTVTTTAQTIGPFSAGAILLTVNTAVVHVRFFRAGESVVAANTGDVLLPLLTVSGPLVFPVREGDVMSIRSQSGTATVQVSQARTN